MALQQLTQEETIAQSKSAYGQWKDVWRKHAAHAKKINTERGNPRLIDLSLIGLNRLAIVVGLGQSLENEIEIIKQYQGREGVDIICVDKAYGVLMERGIKPRLVFVADAIVSYEKWCEPFIEQTKDVILVASVTANEKWSENWRGPVYFSVHKDNIGTHEEMCGISGIEDIMPASSNVGNSLIVLSTQYLMYQEQLLIGYDYSWQPDRNYYAFSGDADGIWQNKSHWQKSGIKTGVNNRLHFTSDNLTFSARWLMNYYQAKIKELPIAMFNCSGSGILEYIPESNMLERLENWCKQPAQPLTEQDIARVRAARARVVRCAKADGMKEIAEKNALYYLDVFCTPKELEPWKANQKK